MKHSIEHPDELLPFLANGTLDGDERRAVEEHVRTCVPCRREVEALTRMRDAIREAAAPETEDGAAEAGLDRLMEAVDGERRSRRWVDFRLWLPLAAAAVLLLAIGLQQDGNRGRPAVVRAGDEATTLRSALPTAGVLPAEAFELRWHAPSAWHEARYSVWVTTTDLRPVAEHLDLLETTTRLPPDTLAHLPSGITLLWRVEALLADGRRVSSSTFSVELAHREPLGIPIDPPNQE